MVASVLYSSAAFADNAARYKECTALATTRPNDGLAAAEAWLAQAPGPSGSHCKALALYTLGRYREAAELLENLAAEIDAKQEKLWLNLVQQAAMARELAGQGNTAIALVEKALRVSQKKDMKEETASLLTARGRLKGKMGNLYEAVQDLDHAASLNPTDHTIRLERAKIYLRLGDTGAAKRDVGIVLKSDPENNEAQKLKAELP